MTSSPSLPRFLALYEAFKSNRPRMGKLAAGFAAASMLRADGAPDRLAADLTAIQRALSEGLGWSAPSGEQRWIYAALLRAQDRPVGDFLQLRADLRALHKQVRGPGLYGGGARAALVLALADAGDVQTQRRFFQLKKALTPPWWRSNAAVTDTFAAGHAATETSLTEIQTRRQRAEAVFKADKRARAYHRDGAKLAALMERDPHDMLAAFNALEDARRADRKLRGQSERSQVMDWAASGMTVEDIAELSAITQALPRDFSSLGQGRARLARLILTADHPDRLGAGPAQSVKAIAAVLAAQAAMVAIIIAASTTTTTATVTS